MPNKTNVEYWHNMAEETRLLADAMTYEATRQIMLELAADFDRLARLALERHLLMTEKRVAQEEAELRKHSEIAETLLKI
jgi:hypothetical protein